MNFSGIGDLAQSLMLRRQGADLKTQLTQLTQELTTGQSQNIGARVNGDFGPLASIERHLGQITAFQQVRDSLNGRMSAVQTSLNAIQQSTAGFGAGLVSAATLGQPDVMEAQAAGASSRMEQTISYLNAQHNGRFLFSGGATDQQPLVSAETMMSELRLIAQTTTDSADLVGKVDAWFNDVGGGFETIAYGGADQPSSSIRISEAASVEHSVLAKADAFREMLSGLALASLVSEGSVPFVDVNETLVSAGENIIAGQNALVENERRVGDVQAKLQQEDSAAISERTIMEEARGKITAVDPFEAASELEAVQFQIETLYVLTARTSQLRLTDYLR